MPRFKKNQTVRRGTVETTHGGKPKGRPKMLTPEQFKDKSKEYFDQCTEYDKAPSLAGLAYHLGFASVQSIFDYRKDPDYTHETRRATLFIEAWLNEKIASKDSFTPGQIFILKSNFGYEDKQSIDHQSSDGSFNGKEQSLAVLEALRNKHKYDPE